MGQAEHSAGKRDPVIYPDGQNSHGNGPRIDDLRFDVAKDVQTPFRVTEPNPLSDDMAARWAYVSQHETSGWVDCFETLDFCNGCGLFFVPEREGCLCRRTSSSADAAP